MPGRGWACWPKTDAFGNTIELALWQRTPRKTDCSDAKRLRRSRVNSTKLDSDLHRLLFDECTADIELTFDDGCTLLAHRAIMAARSPVLHAMLYGDMRESGERKVKLVGISAAAMRCLCQWMYLAKMDTELAHDCLVDIAAAADQYQLDISEPLASIIEEVEVEDCIAAICSIPGTEHGPMLSVLKEECYGVVGANLESCTDADLALLPNTCLVQLLREASDTEDPAAAAAAAVNPNSGSSCDTAAGGNKRKSVLDLLREKDQKRRCLPDE